MVKRFKKKRNAVKYAKKIGGKFWKTKYGWIVKKITGKKSRSSGRGRIIRVSKHQTGTSRYIYDKKRRAKKPGRRISRTGKKYTETRRNRSDKGTFI